MTAETPPNSAQLRQALVALKQLRARVDELESKHTEPIAVVGMACRFPGADSPAAYWTLLHDGLDAISETPIERWDAASLYDSDPSAVGKVATRWGGFVSGIDAFDAAFFGISPREASQMDPQQRLVLEVAYEALEAGGVTLERLAGTRTGVFLGAHSHSSDYYLLQAGARKLDTYSGTGTSHSVLAGRLSYLWDLRGPSVVVDTACSSSLVAVHLACQSLRAGESDVALVGGVNAMLEPTFTEAASRMRMLAADGRCKPFDARADGFVRGEGCGIVVLKRLSEARARGDRVLAVIRGSAVNQDGHSNGLTAPNGQAQRAVLHEALANAGVEPAQLSHVEAHGTGTALGDPIEVEALDAVLASRPVEAGPVVLGAAKSNIGHLESAAGIAGLIKVVLSLQHAAIPRVLHFTQLNPHIRLDPRHMIVATSEQSWPRGAMPRVAGVSSFGWSGTNAHVVLGDADSADAAEPVTQAEAGPWLLPISARSPAALQALAAAYAARVEAAAPVGSGLGELCAAASRSRSQHAERLAVVAVTASEAVERLSAAASGVPAAGLTRGRARETARADGLVFVLAGQGTQWLGMGRELLSEDAAFRAAIEACDAAFGAYTDWSVVGQLTGRDAARMDEVDVVQPLLCALQIGLAAVWESRGVRHAAVVGHSLGEVAAAYLAGALDLDMVARVICGRSRLLRGVAGSGAMALVDLPRLETEAAIAAVGAADEVSVAASNAPRTTVVSGAPGALEAVLAQLSARDVFCRRINVDVASHSPQMAPLAPVLQEQLRGLAPRRATRATFFSTVTGEPLDAKYLDAAYWARNLRQPVEFGTATAALVAAGYRQFVELSPHPALVGAVQQVLDAAGADGVVVGSLRRAEPERAALLANLGELYVHGYPVDWERVTPGPWGGVELPRYPWQHESYWLDQPRGFSLSGLAPRTAVEQPRLGQLVSQALDSDAEVWEQRVDVATRPELYAHHVHGATVLPASAILELLLLGAARKGAHRLREVNLRRAVHLGESEPLSLQTVVTAQALGSWEVRLHARGAARDEPWRLIADARAEPDAGDDLPSVTQRVEQVYPEAASGDDFYARLAAVGAGLAVPLRVVATARWGHAGGAAELQGSPSSRLDGALQLGAAVLAAGRPDAGLAMPTRIDDVRVADGWQNAAWTLAAPRDTPMLQDLQLADADGRVRLELRGVRLRALSGEADPSVLHSVQWHPHVERAADTRASAPPPEHWLICGNRLDDCVTLVEALRARGQRAEIAATHELAARLDGDGSGAGLVLLPTGDGVPTEQLTASVLGVLQLATPRGAQVWLVTRGAYGLQPDEVPDPAQAALWGLGRVFGAEQPELLRGLIDLAPASNAAELPDLLLDGGPIEVAWREGGRWVPHLAPLPDAMSPHAPDHAFQARADATYLITGGLGDIGLAVADWLVDRGARRLLLLGRTALPARQTWADLPVDGVLGRRAARVRALEKRGVSVHLAAVDVTDAVQLDACLSTFRSEEWPRIAGVIHAAAITVDHLLTQLGPSELADVVRTKVRGAELLEAYCDEDLDFCVYFSSLGAVLGQAGQGAYAAANAALDALAAAQRRRGRHVLSVNWGAWDDLGFARTAGGQRTIAALEALGVRSLMPAENLAVLDRLLATRPDRWTAPNVAVLALGPASVATIRRWPVLEGMRDSRSLQPAHSSAGTPTSPLDLPARLAQQAPAERVVLLTTYLQGQIGQVLKLEPARVEPTRPLGALGVDSLAAVELRNVLERDLHVSLSATLVWNYPTVADLVPYLIGRLGLTSVDAEATPESDEPTAVPVSSGERGLVAADLTDDEALQILLSGG